MTHSYLGPGRCMVAAFLIAAGCPGMEDDSPVGTTHGGETASSGAPEDTVSTGDLSTTEDPSDPSSSDDSTTGDETTTTSPESSTSPADTCGDGEIDPGEVCDDGLNNADFGPCKTDCTAAFCGDGIVWEGTEDCDLGDLNGVDESGCSSDCTDTAHCGDGTLDPLTEECDDEDLYEMGICTETCELAGRIVFVTSGTYNGDLQAFAPMGGNGVDGADAICQSLAAEAHLHHPSRFLAWISASQDTAPSQRFSADIDESQPIVLPVDGAVVADSWPEFLSGDLQRPINRTELGDEVGDDNTWTNTTAAGDLHDPTLHCQGWTSSSSSDAGRRGFVSAANELWTQFDVEKCHYGFHRLYCIEMPEDLEGAG